ncbi:uncharacterized protein LOC142182211 [Nicotiana tabacum]|uniref:Uncharacterized protein LOC142182211 n=1 Tax=Nicotiana tabacum TaxID=4097 RepID=A0AC58US91_TOBAC
MKLALRGKGKLVFMDGTYVKSMYRRELAEQLEKCNAIVLPWIGSIVATELMASIVYASNAKKFLMGLTESYNNLRSNLLARRPIVSVNEAYATVSQEESQRLLGVVDMNKDPLTMLAGRTHQGFKPKKPDVIREHYGYKGHLKKNCYKIVGYPQDFKSKKNGTQSGGFIPYYNSTVAGENMNSSEAQGHFFTEQQYKQILNMLNKPTSSDNADYITGNMADTRASHHITLYKELLTTFRPLRDQNSSRVQVHTGGRAEITSIGSYKLGNVLHVPDFKFNLLSVSKITKQLSCVALFFPDFCMFQGLFNGKVLGIGKEKEGLYILQEAIKYAIVATVHKEDNGGKLWHWRLGLLEQYNTLQMSRIKLPRGDKFTSRASKTVFVGYSETQKGYKLYDLENHQIFVSRDVQFKESLFPFKTKAQEELGDNFLFKEAINTGIIQTHAGGYHDQHPTNAELIPEQGEAMPTVESSAIDSPNLPDAAPDTEDAMGQPQTLEAPTTRSDQVET